MRERVNQARLRQLERFGASEGLFANAHMAPKHLKRLCRIGQGADALLRTAIARLKLSARAYHRVLKIARTIADVEGDGDIQSRHVAEAVQYRSLDRPVS